MTSLLHLDQLRSLARIAAAACREWPGQEADGADRARVLEIATLGGARVLNGGDIGALAPGMSADLACVPLDDVGVAGAHHDPRGPLFFCHVPWVKHTVVAGRIIVRDGQLTTINLPVRLERHNRLARRLVADRPCRHRALGAGSYHRTQH